MKNKNFLSIISFIIVLVAICTLTLVSCIKKPKEETETKIEKKIEQSVIDDFAYDFTSKLFPRENLSQDLYYNFKIKVNNKKENSEKEYIISSFASYKNDDIAIKIEDSNDPNKVIYYDGKTIYEDGKAKEYIEFKNIIKYFFIKEPYVIKEDGTNNYDETSYRVLQSYFFKQFSFFFDQVFLGLLPSQIKIKIEEGENISEVNKILSYLYDAEYTYKDENVISIKTKDLETNFLSFLPLDFIYSVKDVKEKLNNISFQFILNRITSDFDIIVRIKGKEDPIITINTKLDNIVKNASEAQINKAKILENLNTSSYESTTFINEKKSFDIEVKDEETKSLKGNLLIEFNPNSIFRYLKIDNKEKPKLLSINSSYVTSYSDIKNKILFELKDGDKQILLIEYNPEKSKSESVNIALDKNLLEKILKNKDSNINISEFIDSKDIVDGYLLFQTSLNVFIDNMTKILVSPNNITYLTELLKQQQNNENSSIYPILEFLEVLNRTSLVDENKGFSFDKKSDEYSKLLKKYKIEGVILTLLKYLPGNQYKITRNSDSSFNINLDIFNKIAFKKFKLKEIKNMSKENKFNINIKDNDINNPYLVNDFKKFVSEYLENDTQILLTIKTESLDIFPVNVKANIVGSNKYLEKTEIDYQKNKYEIYKINLQISVFTNESLYKSLLYIYKNDQNKSKLFMSHNITFYVKVKV